MDGVGGRGGQDIVPPFLPVHVHGPRVRARQEVGAVPARGARRQEHPAYLAHLRRDQIPDALCHIQADLMDF